MRTFIILITILLVSVVVSSSPIDYQYAADAVREHHVLRRSSPVKGGNPVHKGRPIPSTVNFNLRKGEYICGNRICSLQPGEVPKGCNGICQYRVA